MRKRGLGFSIGLAVAAIALPTIAVAAGNSSYSDVEDTNPFVEAIEWATDNGITQGCAHATATEGAKFCPTNAVSRAQMAQFLATLAQAGIVDAGTIDGLNLEDLDGRYDSAAGPAGPTGPAGADGTNGADGTPGSNGTNGAPGATGADGNNGATGPAGPAGVGANGRSRSPRGNTTETPVTDSAFSPEITIGPDGLPIVAYRGADGLRLLLCDDATCSAGVSQLVSQATRGHSPSLLIGVDGNAMVAHLDNDNGLVIVNDCNNPACTTRSETSVAAAAVGAPAMTLDHSGFPVILHPRRQASGGGMNLTRCEAGCDVASTYNVVSGDVGASPAMEIQPNGLPIIAYIDQAADDARVLRCTNANCTTSSSSVVWEFDNTNEGGLIKMAMGDDGLPVLAVYVRAQRLLQLIKCNDPGCFAGDRTTMNLTGDATTTFDITVDSHGRPAVAFITAETSGAFAVDLRYARCTDTSCTAHSTDTLGDASNMSNVSLTIGADGMPLIAFGLPLGGLSVTHCGSETCRPFFRRR